MRISDWSSDVCSSDLLARRLLLDARRIKKATLRRGARDEALGLQSLEHRADRRPGQRVAQRRPDLGHRGGAPFLQDVDDFAFPRRPTGQHRITFRSTFFVFLLFYITLDMHFLSL